MRINALRIKQIVNILLIVGLNSCSLYTYPTFTLIGSNEYENENENNRFVVSIEPLYKNKNDEYETPDKSKRIYKVRFTEGNKFHKISRFRIKRYYEGFIKNFKQKTFANTLNNTFRV